MSRARAIVLALAGLAALGGGACGSGKEAPPAPVAQGALAPGMVAQVGRHAITVPLVAHVAQAQQLPLPEARERAVRDALLASGAEAEKLDHGLDVQLGERAVLARSLLHEIGSETEKAPISDEELAQATAQHWLEVDRPEGFRVVHAVVRLDAGAGEAKRAEARAVAEAIRAALVATPPRASEERPRDPRDPDPLEEPFRRVAEAVPHVGFELRVEPLEPFAADGHVLNMSGRSYDADFARGAAALKERGELSPVLSSPFGAHVILLLERTPAQRLPEAERRAKLRDEILGKRARAAVDAILAGARGRASVASDADALLAQVRVEP